MRAQQGTGKGGGGLLLAGWGSWEEAALAIHQAPPGLLRGTRGRGEVRAGAFSTHFSNLTIKRAIHNTQPQAWTLRCREGNSALSPSPPGHEWLPVDLLTATCFQTAKNCHCSGRSFIPRPSGLLAS